MLPWPHRESVPVTTFTHEQLGERLQALSVPVEPDYLHGVMAGLACAGVSSTAPTWVNELSGCLPDVDIAQHPELFAALQALCEQALGNGALDFQPLLPSDDEFLTLRTQALAQWCDGFVQACLAGHRTPNSDVRETLDDLYAISQMDIDDNYNDPAEAQQNEHDFADLCEYVRMAVLSLYDERPSSAAPAAGNA